MSMRKITLSIEPPPPVMTEKEAFRRVQKIADELLTALGISSLPVDIPAVLEALGIRAVPYSEHAHVLRVPPEKVSWTWQTKDGRILVDEGGAAMIAYNDSILARGRILWTIAHEVAHFVLGHTKHTAVEIASLPDGMYALMEREADAFAAEFLAPKVVLFAMGITDAFSIYRVCRISGEAAAYAEQFFRCVRGCYYPKPYEEKLCRRFLAFCGGVAFPLRSREVS